MKPIINIYFLYVNQLSVGIALLTFMIIWVRRAVQKKSVSRPYDLEMLLGCALAVATVPTAVALLLCSFDTTFVPKLSDFNLHISVAGIVLLFIAFRSISKEW